MHVAEDVFEAAHTGVAGLTVCDSDDCWAGSISCKRPPITKVVHAVLQDTNARLTLISAIKLLM